MADEQIIKVLECCRLINRQKAEIERLQKAIKVQDVMIEQQDYKIKSKSEVIKEFTERLEEYSFIPELSLDGKEVVYVSDINNLLLSEIASEESKNK